MKRAVLALMLAASLGACKTADVMSAGSVALGLIPLAQNLKGKTDPAAAQNGMTKEAYFDTNALYVSTGKRLVAAVVNGKLEPATDADAGRDDFCKLVKAQLARVESPGGELKALDCQAKEAVDDMEYALDHGDSVAFAAAKSAARGFLAAMDKIISAAENGATP